MENQDAQYNIVNIASVRPIVDFYFGPGTDIGQFIGLQIAHSSAHTKHNF